MNEHDRQRLIEDYLDRLARELDDVPASVRRELLEDVRGHVEEAWAASPVRDRVALLNILERLGSPEVLAREGRERLGLGEPQTRRGPGFLEIAAIAFTLLGALAPAIWPVGVLLTWLSPRWLTRDKVVATLVPVLALITMLSMAAVGQSLYWTGPAVTRVVVEERMPADQSPEPGQSPQPETRATPSPSSDETPSARPEQGVQTLLAVALVFGVMLGGPLITALYLAMRMRPRPRRAGTVMLVVAAVLAICVVVALLLTAPATSWSWASGAASRVVPPRQPSLEFSSTPSPGQSLVLPASGAIA